MVRLADDIPSADDVDLEGSGLVGASVVEQLLGGRVIEERHRTSLGRKMERVSIYEAAGGDAAFLALAAAHHARCLADPVLEHPFSHGVHAEHVERLAAYWAEVLGGPPRFSSQWGGHGAVLGMHAGQGMTPDLGRAVRRLLRRSRR